jgi:hypothetical protein
MLLPIVTRSVPLPISIIRPTDGRLTQFRLEQGSCLLRPAAAVDIGSVSTVTPVTVDGSQACFGFRSGP